MIRVYGSSQIYTDNIFPTQITDQGTVRLIEIVVSQTMHTLFYITLDGDHILANLAKEHKVTVFDLALGAMI